MKTVLAELSILPFIGMLSNVSDRPSHDQQATEYVYAPIRAGEIRIITLRPGAWNEPLHASLRDVRLDNEPTYEAISYAWSSPIFDHVLYINDTVIKITESLFTAFRRVRYTQATNGTIPLWADAISINQDDIGERNQQVATMDQIFSKASKVLVWLGEANLDDEIALWTFKCFHNVGWKLIFEENFEDSFEQSKRSCVESPSAGLMVAPTQLRYLGVREGVQRCSAFLEKPWFGRLWVRQEVVLAREAVFLCGPLAMPGQEFISALDDFYLLCEHMQHEFLPKVREASEIAFALRYIFTMYTGNLNSPEQNILNILHKTRTLETSEPLDRVYAIRGLAGLQASDVLSPNYTIAPEALWCEVTKFLLTSSSGPEARRAKAQYSILAIPALQSESSSNNDISWVPNFSDMNHQCSNKFIIYNEVSSKGICSGGNQRSSQTFIFRDNGTLLARGLVITPLADVLSTWTCPALGDDQIGTPEYWLELVKNLAIWYQRCRCFAVQYGGESAVDRLPYVLLQGERSLRNSKGAPVEKTQLSFAEFHTIWTDLLRGDSAFADSVKVDGKLVYDDLTTYFCPRHRFQFRDKTQILAITVDQRLGMVSDNARPGDVVAVIQGAPYPFILRQREDGYWKIVGDAFVEGIMHGEKCPETEQEWRCLAIK